MAGRRGGWWIASVVLAAYLLVIQAALTGLTLGAHAASPHIGLVGGVICSAASNSADPAPAPNERQSPPNCCVMGCAMGGGGAAPAPETASVAPPTATPFALPLGQAFDAAVRPAERSPRTTRAPPQAA